MKKLNVLLLAVALTVSSVLTASTTPTTIEQPESKLSIQIGQLLENPVFEVDADIMAQVTFMVNENQKIVVLTVDTENDQAESFIKSRLNYKKVENAKSGEAYNVPIRIVSEV